MIKVKIKQNEDVCWTFLFYFVIFGYLFYLKKTWSSFLISKNATFISKRFRPNRSYEVYRNDLQGQQIEVLQGQQIEVLQEQQICEILV